MKRRKYKAVCAVFCILGLLLQGCQRASEFQRQNKTPYQDMDHALPAGIDVKRDGVDYGEMDDRIRYYSSTAGGEKECGVLLPAGYDENRHYPVVYVLHGNGGDHYDWNRKDSYLQTLYGNMLADGAAVPAILVMPDLWSYPAERKENASLDVQLAAYDEFYKDLKEDLIPFINSRYKTVLGREGTAIVGTSQGGTEALIAGFMLLDRIGYIGALAPCAGVIEIPGNRKDAWNTPVLSDFTIPDTSVTPYYIQLTVGSLDPWCLQSTQYYASVMAEKKITHAFYELEGLGHEDALWINGLYQFLKRIF